MELLQPLRKIPFLRIVLPYLTGLAAGFYGIPPQLLWLFIVCFIFLTIVLIAVRAGEPIRYCHTWIFGVLLFLMLLLLGAGNVLCRKFVKDRFAIKASEWQTASLVIMDTPEIHAENARVIARICHLDGHQQLTWLKTKALLTLPLDARSKALAPGDVLLLHAHFLPVPGPLNPGEFDYSGYLARQDIDYQVFVNKNAWKAADHKTMNLKILALRCRDNLLDCYRTSGMTHRTIAVLSALTLGYKTTLEEETTELFTRAGVVHVMALSGFNVGLIYLMVNFCLGFLRNRKALVLLRLLISLAAVWAFAVITGLSSSVTRAAIMISLYLAGKTISRDTHPLNILSASAFLMLVFSPLSFLDVGFQLSFAAVTGLIYIQPQLCRLVTPKYWLPEKIWRLFTFSVAAQLATTPLTLYYFHQFPLFFWITNLYVVPLVTLIIYLSVPFILFSFIEPVRELLAGMLEFMINTLLLPLEKLGNIPGALVEGIFISRVQVMLLFLMLIVAGKFMLQKKVVFGLAMMSVLLVLLVINGFRLNAVNRQQYLTVNCIRGASIMNIISGRDNSVLCFSDRLPQDKTIRYAFQQWWIRHGVYRNPETLMTGRIQTDTHSSYSLRHNVLGENVFMCISGIRLVVCTDDVFAQVGNQTKMKMDYAVITNNIRPDIKKLMNHFEMGTVIIDSSVGLETSKKWSSLCSQEGIICWPVREKGAFVVRLK